MYLGLQCLDGILKVIAAHSLLAQVLHMGSDQKIISLFSGPPLLEKTVAIWRTVIAFHLRIPTESLYDCCSGLNYAPHQNSSVAAITPSMSVFRK